MSKELEYEFNNFANLLNKDCMNLMECLKKQDKDNKPILYLGKHFKKVILPYEEYQKMCNRLDSIDNANPSEALENSLKLYKMVESAGNGKGFNLNEAWEYHNSIEQALLKAQKEHKALEIIKEKNVNVYWFKSELTLRNISYRYYVNNFGSFHNGLVVKLLDEEEFNLLKEVLE